VGGVENALGDLEAARAAGRECLEISRRLRETFPEHPTFRKDGEAFEARWRALANESGAPEMSNA
jgi:hypothetical protein